MNFPPPINPDQPPKDDIRIHRMEKDKKRRDFTPEEPTPKPYFLAAVLHYLKKLVSVFSLEKEDRDLLGRLALITDHLQNLKKLFRRLLDEDLSHSPPFIEELTDSWHAVTDPFSAEHTFFLENRVEMARLLDAFIQSINHYPTGEEISLGYYLKNYAGKDWLPFPFMEMLQNLHHEKRQLTEWNEKIEQIISSLSI